MNKKKTDIIYIILEGDNCCKGKINKERDEVPWLEGEVVILNFTEWMTFEQRL